MHSVIAFLVISFIWIDLIFDLMKGALTFLWYAAGNSSTRQFTHRMHRIHSLNIYSFDASKLLILVQTRITKQSFSMHHSRYCVYNNDCRATFLLFYYSAMQVMFYKWLYLNGFLTNVSVLSGKNFILPPPLTEHEKAFSQVLH